ncbi:MAG: uracil-DNA glycosylase family protein [Gemmatimonas sp.]
MIDGASRIIGAPVPPLVPEHGPVYVLLVGEAPGPRGADKSGVPFFGDAAGRHLYAALRDMGAVTLPAELDDLPWDGELFCDSGLRPTAHGIALGNAYDRCPTDDGVSFRPPSRRELASPENIARLGNDITVLTARGLRGIVTMGRVAANAIDLVLKTLPRPELVRRAVVHPSARGLLSLVPRGASGSKMVELQARWKIMCTEAVRDAGFQA